MTAALALLAGVPSFLLKNWKLVLLALVLVFVAYEWRHRYNKGWDEGRADLAISTSKALSEKNDEAARARNAPCVTDPSCVRDDGWRIDKEH